MGQADSSATRSHLGISPSHQPWRAVDSFLHQQHRSFVKHHPLHPSLTLPICMGYKASLKLRYLGVATPHCFDDPFEVHVYLRHLQHELVTYRNG